MAHDPVRATAIATVLLAAAALASFPLLGWPVAVGLTIGLLLGGLNPILARRLLGGGLPFQASSLFRLLVISSAGVGTGLALGVPWAPLAGLAAAQLVLFTASTASYLRQRP